MLTQRAQKNGIKGLTLLCSVSVNLAELWRAPSKGGEGNFEGLRKRLLTQRAQRMGGNGVVVIAFSTCVEVGKASYRDFA